jgi:integrase
VPVVSILRDLRERRGAGRTFVFSGERGGPLSSNPARWSAAVRAACGVEFSPHALRRTFARGMNRLGVSSEMVSRLLGHMLAAGTLDVTERYGEYDFLPERAAALTAWAAYVERLVSGQSQGADVVAIRSRKG